MTYFAGLSRISRLIEPAERDLDRASGLVRELLNLAGMTHTPKREFCEQSCRGIAVLACLLMFAANVLDAAPGDEQPNETEASIGAIGNDGPNLPADSDSESEKWRVAVGFAYGETMLDLKTTLPFNYTDPRTGQRVTPAIGRSLGLTQNGSLDIQARGLGPQRVGQFYLSNRTFTIGAVYSKIDVNFKPLRDNTLPLDVMEGSASGETFGASAEYQYRNSTIFSPFVSYRYGHVRARYNVRNIVGYVPGADIYEAFPYIQAKDGSRAHVGRGGPRIALPLQNWYVGPYWQAGVNRYAIQVGAVLGAVDTNALLIPTDPAKLADAWYSQQVGAAYTADTISTKYRHDESAGLELYMDYRRFLSLKLNVRRNYEAGAWNVLATGLFFFHPNVGISVSALYAEPENARTTTRSYAVGPVATFEF